MEQAVGLERGTRKAVVAWLHLARVYSRIESAHQRLLRQFDLSPAQFDVLSHVCTQPGLSQQALANRLLVTKGNVCGLIDRLGRDGWVERRPAPEDRRVNRLFPTPEGRQLFRQVAPRLEAAIAQELGVLSEREVDRMRGLLGKVDRELRARRKEGSAAAVAK